MEARPTASKAATSLALATCALSFLGGVWTFLDPGLLHGPGAMRGSARGTALVMVAVALPWLLCAVGASRRGSSSALPLWAAALLYVVYNSVLLLFLTPFNAAFLIYAAMLGTALWALGYLAVSHELWNLGARVARAAPVRGLAGYVWVIVALNTAAWLADVIPALDDPYPTPMLEGTGVPTNAIYVQDLAVWLPLAAVAAVWLWRRQARGAVVVGAILGMWVIEGISVGVDQWFGSQADPVSPVVSSALVIPFLTLAAIVCVPLVLLLRSNRSPLQRTLDADRRVETHTD
jgi:hypothetical protein